MPARAGIAGDKTKKEKISHEAVDTRQEHTTTATKRFAHPLTAVQHNVVQLLQ